MKTIKNKLEKHIQKEITDYLKLKKISCAVTNSERVWSKQGFPIKSRVSPDHPDLSAVMPMRVCGLEVGVAFYIEVKTPSGSIRDGQKVRLIELANAGSICMIARSLEEVKKVVEKCQGAELTVELQQRFRTLLKLNLSDRRSKEVRDALKLLESEDSND